MTDSEQFQNAGQEEILHQSSNSREVQTPSTNLPAGLQAGIGLAVASLVLGLVSLSLAILAVGAVAGLIGLILAVIHLNKKLPFRTTAVWGLVFSVLGFIGGWGFGVLYGVSIYQSYSRMMQNFEDTQFEEYIGTAAPDMKFKDIEGNEITLSALKGKRIVLDFFGTWCPPCKKEIPHFIKLRETTNPDELVIIGISNESAEELKAFADKHHINYLLASIPDEELPEPYSDIESVPTTFFIDRQGVIENVISGYHSFEELKDSALGSPKDVNETPAEQKTEDK